MAVAAVVVSWGFPFPGREGQSVQLFGEVIPYLAGLQQRGEVENFEPVMLKPYGSAPEGFIIIRGERAALNQMRSSDEFNRLMIRGTLIMENVAVLDADVGDGVTHFFAEYQRNLDILG